MGVLEIYQLKTFCLSSTKNYFVSQISNNYGTQEINALQMKELDQHEQSSIIGGERAFNFLDEFQN